MLNPDFTQPSRLDFPQPHARITPSYGIGFWLITFVSLLCIYLIVGKLSYTCWPCTKFNCNSSFDASVARSHLQQITSLGPRTAGSLANEIEAATYLRNELLSLAKLGNLSKLHVVFDEQIATYSSFRTYFHVSTYANIRNFLIRFHDPRVNFSSKYRRAFLINCHYDTAPGSPGASDTFVNCAVMLEVCRVLAQGNSYLLNDIIFLFNGAEENMLLASHAFVTQHPWANDTAAFLNLEGAGAGIRLLVFQVGPGEASGLLMEAYSKSFAQPYASVFGEDLFQSGLLPSDTDFRIFRDYGLIPGMDLAYTSDGYVYHTPYDTESRISSDCLQQSGNNILSFVQHIASDERIQQIRKLSPAVEHIVHINSSSFRTSKLLGQTSSLVETFPANRLVYFDFLGFGVICVRWPLWKYFTYTLIAVFCFNLFVVRRFCYAKWYSLIFVFVLQLLVQLLGLGFFILLGLTIHKYGCRMTWYSAHYNIVGAFVLPCIWWIVLCHTKLFKIPNGLLLKLSGASSIYEEISRQDSEIPQLLDRDFFDASLGILALQSFTLTYFNSPTSYSHTVWLALSMLCKFFHGSTLRFVNSVFQRLLYLSSLLLLLSFHSYICSTFFEFIIPIMGRAGHLIKPDLLVALCVFYLMSPITLLAAAYLQRTSNGTGSTLRLLLLNACLSYAILIHASSYGFPYSVHSVTSSFNSILSPRFQRLAIFSTNKIFRDIPDSSNITNTDSHVLLVPMDVNYIRYLKPNSYPSSAPSSFVSVDESGRSKLLSSGIVELQNATMFHCNASEPYCGIPSVYPLLHLFSKFYQIPAPPHTVEPTPNLKLISKESLYFSTNLNKTLRWNFTFSITAGPPTTHALFRMASNVAKLSSWSFTSTASVPSPVPIPSEISDETLTDSPSAHYFIYHLNAEAVGLNGSFWRSPWNFWITVDLLPTANSSLAYFDLAVSAIYTDDKVSVKNAQFLQDVISRLPPWVVVLQGCAVYDRWRFSLM